MKKNLLLAYLFLGFLFVVSCTNSDDDPIVDPPQNVELREIHDFIWRGMNLWYLWQADVANLDDDRFSTNDEYKNFLAAQDDEEEFFESLIYRRATVDKWSWIVDDYIALENQFAGISKSNGVDFGLSLYSSGSSEVFGYVRYILPNSDASDKDIKRGDLFTHVDGQQLTVDNYRELLFGENDTYKLSLAKIEGNTISGNGRSVELTKFEYTENPVFIAKTIEMEGRKIGYLMYNAFTRNFDDQLNEAFLQFKNDGITDLVIDFRYNPGGSVSTAVAMGSMITGQFNGQVFSREQWNAKLQAEITNTNPKLLTNKFGSEMANGKTINSLNLNEVYFIVTDASASASELVINSLSPYINVNLVGERTSGKYTASITLYDSKKFNRNGVNKNHTYAIQPVVLESTNKLGESVINGIEPNILYNELISNMGVLGNTNEPMLKKTLEAILGIVSKEDFYKEHQFERLTNSKKMKPLGNRMIVDSFDKVNVIPNP